jgi:hypothetical protein
VDAFIASSVPRSLGQTGDGLKAAHQIAKRFFVICITARAQQGHYSLPYSRNARRV